jgi:5-methylthioadenosine/S-adenosylhomocysteine deaminase
VIHDTDRHADNYIATRPPLRCEGSGRRAIGEYNPPMSRRLFVLLLLLSASALLEAQGRQPSAATRLLADGIVVTMDPAGRVLNPGTVAVRGMDIVAVGAPEEVRRAYPHAEVIPVPGRVVLPGLVNTHTHLPMVMYRGLADDMALMDWLQQYIFPAEATTVAPSFVGTGTRLAALELIRSGTTTVTDMYYFEEDIAREVRGAGLRGVLGQTIIQFPSPDAKTPADGLARARALIAAYKDDPLITPAVAPHSAYLLDTDTLLACRDLARGEGVPLLIHLAETETEVKTIQEKHQTSPVGYLDQIRFWAPVTVAAHAVWVSDEDVAVLRQRGIGVSHNPESNMKLASGAAPVTKYLSAGIAVGLGTDGAASNNDLDMFEAMRQAAFLQKLVTHDPKVVPARVALAMATIGGARVLGLDRRIGSLEVGKRADLIVVGMRAARQTPMYDPVSHLVYVTRGDDVESVMVNGRFLMRDRRVLTLNEASVLRQARAAAAAVRAAIPR